MAGLRVKLKQNMLTNWGGGGGGGWGGEGVTEYTVRTSSPPPSIDR